eukprot:TRINITY_DN4140_c0_g1_i2.p2 TRINITY_DN4140_c0_g1~~TRINITY_DN4140_c0_g1_i2.p2  ORF type:complete len:102 (+),score=14.33 TRINITY_DN4140_c0_g1_i2:710-1015(+)
MYIMCRGAPQLETIHINNKELADCRWVMMDDFVGNYATLPGARAMIRYCAASDPKSDFVPVRMGSAYKTIDQMYVPRSSAHHDFNQETLGGENATTSVLMK